MSRVRLVRARFVKEFVMSGEMLMALAGSGVLGALGSGVVAVLRLRADSVSAEARVMEVVHEVYDETVEMMRGEISDNREQLVSLRDRVAGMAEENLTLRNRIQFLEAFIVKLGHEVPFDRRR